VYRNSPIRAHIVGESSVRRSGGITGWINCTKRTAVILICIALAFFVWSIALVLILSKLYIELGVSARKEAALQVLAARTVPCVSAWGSDEQEQ
jgi:hypothetical protein